MVNEKETKFWYTFFLLVPMPKISQWIIKILRLKMKLLFRIFLRRKKLTAGCLWKDSYIAVTSMILLSAFCRWEVNSTKQHEWISRSSSFETRCTCVLQRESSVAPETNIYPKKEKQQRVLCAFSIQTLHPAASDVFLSSGRLFSLNLLRSSIAALRTFQIFFKSYQRLPASFQMFHSNVRCSGIFTVKRFIDYSKKI